MIKRPLNPQFADKVIAGIKTTTIRDNPWPVGKPIMLFRWSGKPYRSKQIDIAPVVVEFTQNIDITHAPGGMVYSSPIVANRPIFGTEGFSSPAEMDDWFRPLVKSGQTVTKTLMRFRLFEDSQKAYIETLNGAEPHSA